MLINALDRANGQSRDTVNTHTHTNAPAADQARLLWDLEREGDKRRIHSFSLDNSLIKAKVVVYASYRKWTYEVDVSFNLNGKDCSFTFGIDSYDSLTHEVFDRVKIATAAAVTEHIGPLIAYGALTPDKVQEYSNRE